MLLKKLFGRDRTQTHLVPTRELRKQLKKRSKNELIDIIMRSVAGPVKQQKR